MREERKTEVVKNRRRTRREGRWRIRKINKMDKIGWRKGRRKRR